MDARGKAWKYGDNVDTDVIIPARYLNDPDPAALAAHCMEDIDASFAGAVRKGDLVVAGANFGCGSSREHAPLALKSAGVSCVVAASFARIFYRNAINIGLPILECPAAAAAATTGDEIVIDFASGRIENLTRKISHNATPFPLFLRELIAAGGLVEYERARLTASRPAATDDVRKPTATGGAR
jgi:3-isopropylmalate dehydratase small subunit